jgi:hypothetical protein
MSETPASYGDYPPPIIARVDTLERQLAQVIDVQAPFSPHWRTMVVSFLVAHHCNYAISSSS